MCKNVTALRVTTNQALIYGLGQVKIGFPGRNETNTAQEPGIVKTASVAVLLSMDDEDEIERLLMAYSPKLQRILQAADKQIRAGKGIKHKDFWTDIAAGR